MSEELRQYINILNEAQGRTISCRSTEGVTVGVIDSFITLLRIIRTMDLSPHGVQEALKDIGDDEDMYFLLDEIKKAKN